MAETEERRLESRDAEGLLLAEGLMRTVPRRVRVHPGLIARLGGAEHAGLTIRNLSDVGLVAHAGIHQAHLAGGHPPVGVGPAAARLVAGLAAHVGNGAALIDTTLMIVRAGMADDAAGWPLISARVRRSVAGWLTTGAHLAGGEPDSLASLVSAGDYITTAAAVVAAGAPYEVSVPHVIVAEIDKYVEGAGPPAMTEGLRFRLRTSLLEMPGPREHQHEVIARLAAELSVGFDAPQ